MAQSSHTFNDVAGLAHLAELNAEAEANATLNSGATEPTVKYPGMLWLYTGATPPVLRQRNQANDAWNDLSVLIDAEIMPSPSASGFVLRNAANDKNETKTASEAAAVLSPFIALGKNAIINGNFTVNQLGKSGTVTLAAGGFGHDCWKAGASGCTYTFATVENVTTLTITAGSLQQTIEGINLQSGTYVLSWQGTAQGKIGAGSYGAAGVTASVTGGTNLTIEFGTGTLRLVQFEPGSVATPYEFQPTSEDERRCLRFAQRVTISARSNLPAGGILSVPVYFQAMYAVPTATLSTGGSVTNVSGTPSFSGIGVDSARLEIIASASGDTFALGRRYLLEARL